MFLKILKYSRGPMRVPRARPTKRPTRPRAQVTTSQVQLNPRQLTTTLRTNNPCNSPPNTIRISTAQHHLLAAAQCRQPSDNNNPCICLTAPPAKQLATTATLLYWTVIQTFVPRTCALPCNHPTKRPQGTTPITTILTQLDTFQKIDLLSRWECH